MSGVQLTAMPAQLATSQVVSTEQSQEQQSIQYGASKIQCELEEAGPDNDSTAAVNEILLKLLVTSMYDTQYFLVILCTSKIIR